MSGIYDTFKGSITGEVLTFNPDAIPEPDTLFIRMTRGEHRIADELRKAFGGFKRVIIDVDGEQHEFRADSLIGLLEGYEGASSTRYYELFGTPERAARTLARMDVDAYNWCVNSSGNPEDCKSCPYEYDYYGCYLPEKFSMLEWLRGDAE